MHIDFEKNGYFVIRNFFDEITVLIFQKYWDLKWKVINFNDEERTKAAHTKLIGNVLTKYDVDVADSFNFYGDPLIESLELLYGQKVCEILKADLTPTYTYTRIYEKGSYLIPHVDRDSCEVSATCPVLSSDSKPSTIFLSNFKWDGKNNSKRFSLEEIKQKGDYSEVNLYPGDLLLYNGVERYHWREPIESDYIIQFFMHFVQTNGKYKDFVFDKRPYMGFPNNYKDFL